MAYTREKRIQQIKDCGQSIIDNAERIYGDYKYSRGLEIVVRLDVNEVPTITVLREFLPERFIES